MEAEDKSSLVFFGGIWWWTDYKQRHSAIAGYWDWKGTWSSIVIRSSKCSPHGCKAQRSGLSVSTLHVTTIHHFSEKNTVPCTFFAVGWVFLIISLKKNFKCSVLFLICLLLVMQFLEVFSFISSVELVTISWQLNTFESCLVKICPFLPYLQECNMNNLNSLLIVCADAFLCLQKAY